MMNSLPESLPETLPESLPESLRESSPESIVMMMDGSGKKMIRCRMTECKMTKCLVGMKMDWGDQETWVKADNGKGKHEDDGSRDESAD